MAAGLAGLIFGSFMNVLISRLPDGKSVVTPPSACPECDSKIKPYDNIPVFSYIILKGRCRNCGVRIPLKYPVVEIATAVMFVLTVMKFGLNIEGAKALVFVFLLLTASFTDLFTAFQPDKYECGIIPDEISLGGLAIGIIFSFFTEIGIVGSLIGAAAGFLSLYIPAWIYQKVKKVEGMGGGDLKLIAMIGAFLGWKSLYFVVFGSALLGVLVSVPFVIFMKNWRFMIPYGPFISIAAMIYMFYSEVLLRVLGFSV